MKRCGALLSALCLLAAPLHAQESTAAPVESATPPSDADAEQAKAFFEIGAHAYERGHYADAISAFEQAYRIAHRTGLLFSIAQAHRRAFYSGNDATHLSAAIEQYRAYLARDPEGVRRADAERALAELVPMQNEQARREASGEPAPVRTRLMISSSTPGAHLLLDQHPVQELPYVTELSAGAHQVLVSAPGFRAEQRAISLPEGTSFAVNIDLVEEPGSLMVTGPAGGELFLEGRSLGVLPLPPVPLRAGPHRLSLRKAGYEFTSLPVQVDHGAATAVQLTPRITRRRELEFVLLGVGAAAAVSALSLGGVALVQQHKAQTLLDRSEQRAWSPAEYEQYQAASNRRDDFRNAAWISAGLSGALGLSSLLLYLSEPLDPPPLRDEPGVRPESPRSPEILGSLWGTPHAFGVDLNGHF